MLVLFAYAQNTQVLFPSFSSFLLIFLFFSANILHYFSAIWVDQTDNEQFSMARFLPGLVNNFSSFLKSKVVIDFPVTIYITASLKCAFVSIVLKL